MKYPKAVGRLLSAVAVLSASSLFAQNSELPLEIYWIDVEGGSSTLIVTPAREAVLMDAGWNREDARDALRIQAAMQDAGITEIDYFIASHFHGDHVGGVPAIARRVPIHQFRDHGDSVEQEIERSRLAWETYLSAAQGRRQTVRPGDALPLTGNVEFSFVAANREIIESAGASINRHCSAPMASEDLGENSHSVGYMVSVGDFEFLDLGDMTVDVQQSAACPENRLGIVDLLQVPHHGQDVAAELLWALEPTVAISNNGASKGGRADDLAIVQQIPRIEGFWQVHRAMAAPDSANTTPQMTANLTEEGDQGYWIKATIEPSGERYQITNARNGYSRTYQTK
jgi:beta-lactamase superfamily II metal-dependent hydrolase